MEKVFGDPKDGTGTKITKREIREQNIAYLNDCLE